MLLVSFGPWDGFLAESRLKLITFHLLFVVASY